MKKRVSAKVIIAGIFTWVGTLSILTVLGVGLGWVLFELFFK